MVEASIHQETEIGDEMTDHAPLPWAVGNGGREVLDAKRRIVARLLFQYQQPPETYAANSALIVAAVNAFGWRTMESAPREPVEILTFAPDRGVAVSKWASADESEPDSCETWRDDGVDPTHWMPILSTPTK